MKTTSKPDIYKMEFNGQELVGLKDYGVSITTKDVIRRLQSGQENILFYMARGAEVMGNPLSAYIR